MRVLVACEFSGVVRRAFRARGHDAWSCDLLPAEDGSEFHFTCDVRDVIDDIDDGWDLMIAHPPCTHLAVSGARWFKDKRDVQLAALGFVEDLMDMDLPRICIENPVSIISTEIRKPDQIIQPWQFGHGETKATCLWLKNLPPLKPTNIVEGRVGRVHHEPPSRDRWKNRSRTYQGIANAMAEQWGILVTEGEEMKPRKPVKKVRRKPRPGRLKSKALEQLRRDCFERDAYLCQGEVWYRFGPGELLAQCGRTVTWESGHMAHIKAKRIGGDSLDNVRTLCPECHDREHRYGKSGVKPCPPKERRA